MIRTLTALMLTCVLSSALCVAQSRAQGSKSFEVSAAHFAGVDGCVLVYDLKAKQVVATYGEERCRQRYTACSTFKWPLAVMAFDAGVMQDENSVLKWDGVKRQIESWNQDHTARTWMQNSVVWYSQQITPMLGAERFKRYVKAFAYGNQDVSAGLTSAWLTVTKLDTDPGRGSLKISAYEQIEFVEKFWSGKLPVNPSAIEKTKKLIYLETSPAGYVLHGKTGSGYLADAKGDFGWFVAHVEGSDKEYAVVTTFTRQSQSADSRFPGLVAKEITKKVLAENWMW